MAVPVLAGIAAVLVKIWATLATARQIFAFVITGVVWGIFLYVSGIFLGKANQLVDRISDVQGKADLSVIPSPVISVLDKIAFIFPIWEFFAAVAFYFTFCGSLLFLQWLLQAWDMLPFKDSAGK